MRTHRSESRRAGEEVPYSQVSRGQQNLQHALLQFLNCNCNMNFSLIVTPEALQLQLVHVADSGLKAKLQTRVADLPPRLTPVEIKG